MLKGARDTGKDGGERRTQRRMGERGTERRIEEGWNGGGFREVGQVDSLGVAVNSRKCLAGVGLAG